MTITLHLGQGASLKAKRKVVRSLTDRVRARFNAAAAEVGAQDLWQRIELGFSVCGNETAHVENQLGSIRRFVERLALAEITDVRLELINLKEMTWAPAAQNDWAT